jgi:serine/threonine protein phosphatase PrpC
MTIWWRRSTSSGWWSTPRPACLASWSVGPDEALRFLNRAMLGESLEGRFITVAYLRGTLLGVWPDIRLQTMELTLEHGDTILLYTDGVSDPGPGPERRPTEALRDRARGAGADQFADTLQRYATQPDEAPRDDIAIVAVQFADRRRGEGSDREGAGQRACAGTATTRSPPVQ